MQVNKFLIWFLPVVLCISCVDPYEPVIEESQEVMVINGYITDKPGIHKVSISRSAPFNNPVYRPLQGCVVRIRDDQGNMVIYMESGEGPWYEGYLDSTFLKVGSSYALVVNTPDGEEYQSSYDTLLACPPVDTLYFEVEEQGSSIPGSSYWGVQFFLDVKGSPSASRNFRWLLEETYEYTSAYTSDWILLQPLGPVDPYISDTVSHCYMTLPVNQTFSGSTRFLAENRLNRQYLNFVSNRTPRLKIKYSLLVKQHSLTNEIFDYWDRMRTQSSETGGFYETQPSSTVGNISNSNDPGEKVLGCFYATQEQAKRLTVRYQFDFPVQGYSCQLDTLYSLVEFGHEYPYYVFSLSEMTMGGPPYLTGDRYCFDCRELGGENTRPEYWTNE
jgi:hypothetical protein